MPSSKRETGVRVDPLVPRTVAGSVQKLSHFRGLVLRGRIGRFPVWCSPGRGHHTICSKLHAKPEERSGGHVRRLSAQVFSLARIPIDLPSGKVRHDIRDEKFTGLFVVPLIIAIDQQVDAGVLVLPDQVNGLGHRNDKAAQWSVGGQSLALCRQRGRIAGKQSGLDTGLFARVVIAARGVTMSAQHRELVPYLRDVAVDDIAGVT